MIIPYYIGAQSMETILIDIFLVILAFNLGAVVGYNLKDDEPK